MMILLLKSCPRSSSLLPYQYIRPYKLPYHSIRKYAASRQPRPYNQPKPASKIPAHKPGLSTKSPTIPLQAILPTQTPQSRINPPSSTLPPPLDLPNRTIENGQQLEWYKYYYRLGKAYGGFYMTALKAIWANYKSTQGLLKALPSANIAAVRQAVREGTLSRADFQSIRRSKSDVSKLPPFILLWCICGEFTPLVIVFVTGLVPRILWIPKQVQKAREKAEERRRRIRQKSDFGGKPSLTVIQQNPASSTGAKSREAYRYLAQWLQVYPAWWDQVAPSLIPSGLVHRRVEARFKDLDVDDFAIVRDGGVRGMDEKEVFMACEDRGIEVLGRDDGTLRRELEGWIQDRKSI